MLNSIYKRKQKQKKMETKMENRCANLMNNAVYGKTMEKKQNQNRIDLKLVSNKKDYLKWTL